MPFSRRYFAVRIPSCLETLITGGEAAFGLFNKQFALRKITKCLGQSDPTQRLKQYLASVARFFSDTCEESSSASSNGLVTVSVLDFTRHPLRSTRSSTGMFRIVLPATLFHKLPRPDFPCNALCQCRLLKAAASSGEHALTVTI